MKPYVLWVVLALLSAQVSAMTVVVVGDSLSAGYGLRPNEGWVSLMGKTLSPHHRVVNASVSGETSAGGLTRLPAILRQQKPDVVIVALGGNDGLRGLPLDEMAGNLEKMLHQVRAAGASPVLVGMALPPNYGEAYVRSFAQVYAKLARQSQVVFVPMLLAGFETRQSWFQADGIHPTAVAQPTMLNHVLKALNPLLAKKRS